MNFPETLETILKEKNIKKVQLKNDLGISKENIQSWKRGSQASIERIITLAQYLNVSTDELLGLPNRDKKGDAPPDPDDPDNIREIANLAKQLPEREQIKWIGKLEEAVNNLILDAQ